MAGGRVQDHPSQPVGIRMAELDVRQLLGMMLQQPGVIDHGGQDQRLAHGERAMAAAHDR
jgi:hypothetical protein